MLSLNKSTTSISKQKSLLKSFIVATTASAISAISLGLIADSARAISLIGNTTNINAGAFSGDALNDTSIRLARFTIPVSVTTPYKLNSVTLRLSNYNSTNDIVQLSIFSGISGGFPVNSLLGASDFSTPATNPLSSFNPLNFQFNVLSTSNLVFTPNETYWLGVSAAAGSTVTWVNTGTPDTLPSSSLGVNFNSYSTVGAADSGLDNAFNIDVTPVPFEFEASGGVAVLGGLFLANKLRKRNQKVEIDEKD